MNPKILLIIHIFFSYFLIHTYLKVRPINHLLKSTQIHLELYMHAIEMNVYSKVHMISAKHSLSSS